MTPKIYCFSVAEDGGEGVAYAMAEDGEVLGSHWCSSESFVPSDLGVLGGSRPDRHITYAEHYPDGYEMQFVRASELDGHPGFQAALAENKKLAQQNDEENGGHHETT